MASKPVIQRCFWIVFLVLSVSCGIRVVPVSPTISLTDINRTAVSIAFRTAVAQTVSAMPTLTVGPTATQDLFPLPTVSFSTTHLPGQYPTLTAIPTSTPPSFTPAPTRTPLPFVPLEGLRVADEAGGNLYIQDSGKQAIRLTDGGQDSNPLLSDDGQKIAFYRGWDELCVIRVDGSGERTLVSREMLSAYGYDNEFIKLYDMAFLPGTHQLLFNTWIYNRKSGEGHHQRNDDLWFVDTDTGTLRQLRAPGQGGNFLAAPNGKWIAVQTVDHIDVVDAQGQIIRRNLVTNPPMDDYYGITWASMSWTPNSSELIVLSTSIPPGTGVPVVREAWRYPLDGRPVVEIKLSPPPVGDAFSISPDGNWIAYSFPLDAVNLMDWIPELVSWDPETPIGVYLGNLHDGTSQLLYTPPVNESGYRDVPLYYNDWSPDSVHFILEDDDYRMLIGNIHGKITPLGRGTGILGWIDDSHYLFAGGTVVGEVGTLERTNVMGAFPYYEVAGYDDNAVSFVFLGP